MRFCDGGSVSWVLALGLAAACGGDDGGAGPGQDGGGGGVVEVTTYFGEVPEPVAFAAVQDGDGAWERLESEDGVYSFEVESGRYGFAHACEPDSLVISFFYSTVEEGARANRGCFRQPGDGDENEATVLITVNGLEADEIAQVSVASSESAVYDGAPMTGLYGVPAGARDVFVTVAPNFNNPVERILVERDIELAAGETLELEVDVAEAVAATQHTITLEGYEPSPISDVYLETRNGSRPRLGTYREFPVYAGFPDAIATDMYRVLVDSGSYSTSPTTHYFTRTPGDLTFTEPPPLTIDDASAATTTPHVRAQLSFDRTDGAAYSFSFRNFRPDRIIEGYLSAGWLGGQPSSFSWEQPDLSGLAGWAESLALIDDQEVTATITEFIGDVDPLVVLPQVPPSHQVEYTDDLDGKSVSLVVATATFVP